MIPPTISSPPNPPLPPTSCIDGCNPPPPPPPHVWLLDPNKSWTINSFDNTGFVDLCTPNQSEMFKSWGWFKYLLTALETELKLFVRFCCESLLMCNQFILSLLQSWRNGSMCRKTEFVKSDESWQNLSVLSILLRYQALLAAQCCHNVREIRIVRCTRSRKHWKCFVLTSSVEHKEEITEEEKRKKNLKNGHLGSHLKNPRAAEELTNSEIEPYVSGEITRWNPPRSFYYQSFYAFKYWKTQCIHCACCLNRKPTFYQLVKVPQWFVYIRNWPSFHQQASFRRVHLSPSSQAKLYSHKE